MVWAVDCKMYTMLSIFEILSGAHLSRQCFSMPVDEAR